MNADTFYEFFKDALGYLGCSWGDKELATVWIEGNEIKFAYKGKTASFSIGKAELK